MKKQMMTMMMLAAMMTMSTSCQKDDTTESYNKQSTVTEDNSSNNTNNSGTSSGTGSGTMTGDLTSFDISIDKTTAEPTNNLATAYYPEEEDNLANNSFSTQVAIDMSNPTASSADGVTISVNGNHVVANHADTKNVCYYVTGSTSNGSLTILGDKKYEVILAGTDITNPDSAALNLLSKKRAFVVLADGSTNKLTDGSSSKNDHKGALYSKGKLLMNGNGTLEVYGNYNNGIHSADYIIFNTGNNVYAKSTQNHGIKANDGIFINGGILNVEVSAAAAKGINSESNIIVNGGRTTVITTGNGAWDSEDQEAKGAAGIKADSTFTMNGGELWLKSTGSGGKGINADMNGNFYGGSTYIVTTGGQFQLEQRHGIAQGHQDRRRPEHRGRTHLGTHQRQERRGYRDQEQDEHHRGRGGFVCLRRCHQLEGRHDHQRRIRPGNGPEQRRYRCQRQLLHQGRICFCRECRWC